MKTNILRRTINYAEHSIQALLPCDQPFFSNDDWARFRILNSSLHLESERLKFEIIKPCIDECVVFFMEDFTIPSINKYPVLLSDRAAAVCWLNV